MFVSGSSICATSPTLYTSPARKICRPAVSLGGNGISSAGGRGMRLFVVRHEKRNRGDATFLSPLLPEGHADAKGRLLDVITAIAPTHIYASPFLRVLQTVKPYLEATHLHAQPPLLLNVDYSLYESPNPDPTGAIGELHPEWQNEFHISPTYTSFTPPSRLQSGWGFGDSLPERTASFLAYLAELHGDDPDAHVLLASHQYTIHSLISLTTGQDTREMDFPQGEVLELDWRNVHTLTTERATA